MHADPLTNDVATDEAKTGATFGDLTTVGPAVTKTLVNNQRALVTVSSRTLSSTDGNDGNMSFAVSGATTLAASEVNGGYCFISKVGSSAGDATFRQTVFQATAGGSHTFTAKYRSDGTGNLHFINRRIIVKPY